MAKKKGVKIHLCNPRNPEEFERDIDAYYKMLKETTQRDGFSAHNKDVYRNMVEVLTGHNFVKFYIAEYEGKILAATIVTYFKDTATYYYGVSSNHCRNLMAPYLLQWEAIKEAKKHEMKTYDFLGISPPHAKDHSWKGVTEFKRKFGGKEVSYTPPQEYAYKPFIYWLYRIYKWQQKLRS